MATTKKVKYPKSIGACVDLLGVLDEKVEAAKLIVKVAEKEYRALEDHIIASFKKDDIKKAAGAKHTLGIEPHDHPTVEDWNKLVAYVKKKNAFDLFTRRLNSTAVRARWAEKVAIPGVGKFTKNKLTLTKIRRSGPVKAPKGTKQRKK